MTGYALKLALCAPLLALPAALPAADKVCATMVNGVELGCPATEACQHRPGTPAILCKCISRSGEVYSCRRIAGSAGKKAGLPGTLGVLPGPEELLKEAIRSGVPAGGPPLPSPEDPAGHLLREGDAAYDRGDYGAAAKNYERASDMSPAAREEYKYKLAESLYRYGRQILKKGNEDQAIECFKRALKLNEGHRDARGELEEIVQRRNRAPSGQIDPAQFQSQAGPVVQGQVPARLGAKPGAAPYAGVYQMGGGSERPQEPAPGSNKPALILMISGIAAALAIVLAFKFRRDDERAAAGRQAAAEGAGAAGEAPEQPAAADFGSRVRELMNTGRYDKAQALFAARSPSAITDADRLSLFEIHLRRGNVDGARMVYESVKNSALLAEDPGLAHTLSGLCAGVGLDGPADELTRTKSSGKTTAPSTAGNIAAGELDDSLPYQRAVALAKEAKYDQALAAVLEKPKDKLTLNDHCLLFEIYLRRRDFDRAELMLAQMDKQVAAAHPVKRVQGRLFFAPGPSNDRKAPAFCAALARVSREKKRPDFALRLCRMAVDCALTSLRVREKPQECYELALALEADGERNSALELFRALSENGPPYKDSSERWRRLDALATSAPAVKTGAPVQGVVLAGRYELHGEIGSGGMGVVYAGSDRMGGSRVAVKRMHSSLKNFPREYERFIGEAKIVEKLKHPNIVGVRGVVEQGGETYLVFDFVDGRTLADLLREKQRLPLELCKDIFRDVCGAVHFAHGHSVIHRDIKPANIMLTADNRAKVMDFGLASELRESMTRLTHQTTSGTPAYMAPEQHTGLVKKESDIYALGVCLYEMLTGKLPFDGQDYEGMKLAKGYKEISAVLPWLPAGVDNVVDRALAPEPSQRYADAMEFYTALNNL